MCLAAAEIASTAPSLLSVAPLLILSCFLTFTPSPAVFVLIPKPSPLSLSPLLQHLSCRFWGMSSRGEKGGALFGEEKIM